MTSASTPVSESPKDAKKGPTPIKIFFDQAHLFPGFTSGEQMIEIGQGHSEYDRLVRVIRDVLTKGLREVAKEA